jgi:hypothetical protein
MQATKKLIYLFLMIGTFALLSACSHHTPVKQDYSSKTKFVEYKHYNWLANERTAKLKSQHPFVAERIEAAILSKLHSQGNMIVRDKPEAYIGYDYVVRRTESLEPTTTFGWGFGGRHYGFRGMFPIEYETKVYEEVEWIVDIYDSNQKLVWRGSVMKPLQEFSAPKDAEAYTEEVIIEIMDKYPPK